MIIKDYFYVVHILPDEVISCLGKVGDPGNYLTDLYTKYYITKIDGDNITAKKYIRTTKKTHKDLFEEEQIFSKEDLLANPKIFTTKTAINKWKDNIRDAVMQYKDYLGVWLKDINNIKIRSTVDK